MPRPGSVTIADFRKLLSEDEFVDFFNKFICLPAFSQLILISRRRHQFLFNPPLPKSYTLNNNGLIEWLWRKRLDLFIRSKFFGEYRLCMILIHHSFIRETGAALHTDYAKYVHNSLRWLQRRCLGKVSKLRRFRQFLSNTGDGLKFYLYWLDAERLYFHLKVRSADAADFLDAIKEIYFFGTSERKMPEHLLDAASEMLPPSYRTEGVAQDAKFYDATFTICLQGICENRMKNYWLPRFLLQQDVSCTNENEIGFRDTALQYLRGRIKLVPDSVPSEPNLAIDTEGEEQNDENGGDANDGRDDSSDNAEAVEDRKLSNDKEPKPTKRRPDDSSRQKKTGVGIIIRVHKPVDAPDSDEQQPVQSNKGDEDGRECVADTQEEYTINIEVDTTNLTQKEGAGAESRSLGGKTQIKRKNSDSSDESESSESGDEDSDEKNRNEDDDPRNKDIKRSLDKRKWKFERLLTKESYRTPAMTSEKLKLFSKGKVDIRQQKILLDDDETLLRDRFEQSPLAFEHGPRKPRKSANLTMGAGGKALLKAALRYPGSSRVSRTSFSEPGYDNERPDIFNKTPSFLELPTEEGSGRMTDGRRPDGATSLDNIRSSRMSLLSKVGKLRRPSHPRSPSQESEESTVSKKKKTSSKSKPKKAKVTTFTFSLSGETPAEADDKKSKKDKAKSAKRPKWQKAKKDAKGRRIATRRVTLPLVISTTQTVSAEYTMEKDNNYRGLPENSRMIMAMQSDDCASQPFRTFLIDTDNEELVPFLAFWQDVEKTRQDFQFGTMSFDNFLDSMHGIATNYLVVSAPLRIEAPEGLREDAAVSCLSPELQEMPWQIRKLQREAMEDLRFAYETFAQQETQSFLVAATFKKDERTATRTTGLSFLPPIECLSDNKFKEETDERAEEDDEFAAEMKVRMSRSLRYVMDMNLPDGRDIGDTAATIDDESDDDGYLELPPPPVSVLDPPMDYKELASRSVRQYPDPNNPTSINITVTVPYKRRLNSIAFYRPLKKGGRLLKRPMVKPETFHDLLKDVVHFQFFKRFLKAYRAENLLTFWGAVEGLRVAEKVKFRQMKAQSIVKRYFHNPKMPATKLLQCNADIIKEIPYLDVVTTTMLFSAQDIIGRVLEERWFRRYSDTLEERPDSTLSNGTSRKTHTARTLLSRNRRQRRVWLIFNDFIGRCASFLRSMKKPHLFDSFEKFLRREMDRDSASTKRMASVLPFEIFTNGSESSIAPFMFSRREDDDSRMKQRMVNGKLIATKLLINDLHFWRDIECYKYMSQGVVIDDKCMYSFREDGFPLRKKAKLIVSCYLDSDVPPRIRVNVPAEVAEITIESMHNGLIDRTLFHEATIYVFPLLIQFWKK